MQLQREQQMQQHQQRMEEHQIAMEQHQLRMETIGMERERIKAEQDAQKEQKENDKAAMSLYISNNLDPASMKYDEQRKALYKDPDFLRIVANKDNGGIVAQVKDFDKQHKDVYNYWSKTFEENKIKGDPRDPNILKQDEDGVPIWDKHFDSVIQQSKLDAQREEAMRPPTMQETKALEERAKLETGLPKLEYLTAKAGVVNPKGIQVEYGTINENGKFEKNPDGRDVQITDNRMKNKPSYTLDRSLYEDYSNQASFHRTNIDQRVQELGISTPFGAESMKGPMEESPAKKLDLSQIGGFGVAPKQGMNVEVTGDLPLNMGSSKEATAPSGYTPKSESMGTPADEIMQSAGSSKAAPFNSSPAGQPKSSETPSAKATSEEQSSSEPSTEKTTPYFADAYNNLGKKPVEGTIDDMNKKADEAGFQSIGDMINSVLGTKKKPEDTE